MTGPVRWNECQLLAYGHYAAAFLRWGAVNVDPIPIAATNSVGPDVARPLQVRQDPSHGTLGDAHGVGNLQPGAVRPKADVREY